MMNHLKIYLGKINGSNRVVNELRIQNELITGLREKIVAQNELITGLREKIVTQDELITNLREKVITQSEKIDRITYLLLREKCNKLLSGNRPINIQSKKKIAYDSNDHINPWGTKQDNSINLRFNVKLKNLIPFSDQYLLDLGCSGGGLVRSFIEEGIFAIGIEGSDFSSKILRAEWSSIPEFLFTGDITEPFELLSDANPLKFKVITLWEVIEHIKKDKLEIVFQNINHHLEKNGLVIMSVSTVQDEVNGYLMHETVENFEWWMEKVNKFGFKHHADLCSFFGNDTIRPDVVVWDENEKKYTGSSFIFYLTRENESLSTLNE